MERAVQTAMAHRQSIKVGVPNAADRSVAVRQEEEKWIGKRCYKKYVV